jgi:hypothetical protein
MNDPLDELPEADEHSRRWDANDARGREDCFAPPAEPCECYCLHCQRVFMSDRMWFQRVVNSKDGFKGFWMCPTPNCGGAGFTFDIFPTDPDHPANEGWHSCDESDEFDEEGEWDPDETSFKELDEACGDEDDDIEGEEWKYGLQPGEPPPEPEWAEKAPKEWEEEQKQYDEPDRRPRELDWSNRGDDTATDDIPF